jgi:hypothetical protein
MFASLQQQVPLVFKASHLGSAMVGQTKPSLHVYLSAWPAKAMSTAKVLSYTATL